MYCKSCLCSLADLRLAIGSIGPCVSVQSEEPVTADVAGSLWQALKVLGALPPKMLQLLAEVSPASAHMLALVLSSREGSLSNQRPCTALWLNGELKLETQCYCITCALAA